MEHPSWQQPPNTPADNHTFSPTSPSSPPPLPTSSFQNQNSTSLSARLAAKNPAFLQKLQQMSLQLAPLVQLTTGQVHPSFPRTLLAFWLLTEPELDSLAHFYHQRTPCAWTAQYPCPVLWGPGLSIEDKRRKLGRFIGLRGCETPVPVSAPEMMETDDGLVDMMGRSEEEIVARARRERVGGGDEVEEVGRKMGWY
ncbi:hypothetical protein N657DRAFT_563121 [Parathielavia appendiculata]|uniref:Uncharacterized protein n=1 Tax=Parathielavia appendiculata TaxID=2587402 RepID=A0AAN6U8G8_9PEZI|nr:hypothetical protein N657DRAFT_563121 [Parathielavia appendiculata]